MRQQLVQPAVQAVVVHLVDRHAQQVGQCAVPVKVFGDVQLARWLAQAGDDQNQRRQRPGNVLLPRRHHTLQKLMQFQLLDQFQRQPRSAELTAILDPQTRAVDLDELRLCLRFRKQTPLARPPARFNGFLHAQPARFVDLSQVGDGPLPRTALGAIRLDESPIRLTSAILPHIRGAQEHAAMLPLPRRLPRREVCTTQTLAADSPCAEGSIAHRSTTYLKIKLHQGPNNFQTSRFFLHRWGSWANSVPAGPRCVRMFTLKNRRVPYNFRTASAICRSPAGLPNSRPLASMTSCPTMPRTA
jgi:hypothetical protein